MDTSTLSPTVSAASSEASLPSLFPADMPVSYDAAGNVVSRYGDSSWDLSSMSTDGTSTKTLHFHRTYGAAASNLNRHIQDQQKALMWKYKDAGKTRAWVTLRNSNLALTAWCEKAANRGMDLYSLLSNPELVAEGSQDLNANYVNLTSTLLKTLWRHRHELGAPVDLQLLRLRDALSREVRTRPDTQQTPLIPSRVYCGILATLGDRMSLIERELETLLGVYAQTRSASPNAPEKFSEAPHRTFDAESPTEAAQRMKGLGYEPASGITLDQFIVGKIAECQVALMLVVAAYTGMRVGEVAILPLEDVLTEFVHLGSTHYELQSST